MAASQHEADQRDEAAALQSIFGEDFAEVSSRPVCYELVVKPDPSAENFFVALRLRVRYPRLYPDELPSLEVLREKGLTDAQLAEALALAQKTAAENKGAPSIYTVADALRDWLLPRNTPEKNMHDEMMERKQERARAKGDVGGGDAQEADEADEDADEDAEDSEGGGDGGEEDRDAEANRKRREEEIQKRRAQWRSQLVDAGAPVTPESFAAWYAKFRAERDAERKRAEAQRSAEEKAATAAAAAAAPRGLTGRQIFERDLLLGLAEQPTRGGREERKQEDVFWFNESAYADDGDLPEVEGGGDGEARDEEFRPGEEEEEEEEEDEEEEDEEEEEEEQQQQQQQQQPRARGAGRRE